MTTDHVRPRSRRAHGARGRWITKVGVRLDGGPQRVYAIDSPRHDARRLPEAAVLEVRGPDPRHRRQQGRQRSRPRPAAAARPASGSRRSSIRDDAPGSQHRARARGHAAAAGPARIARRPVGDPPARHPHDDARPTPARGGASSLPTAPVVLAVGHRPPQHRGEGLGRRPRARHPRAPTPAAITADSSERLANPKARASSAFDGDPATAWNSRSRDLAGPVGQGDQLGAGHVRPPRPPAARRRPALGADPAADQHRGRHRRASSTCLPVAPVDGIAHVTVQFEPLHGPDDPHHARHGAAGDDPRREPCADHAPGRASPRPASRACVRPPLPTEMPSDVSRRHRARRRRVPAACASTAPPRPRSTVSRWRWSPATRRTGDARGGLARAAVRRRAPPDCR